MTTQPQTRYSYRFDKAPTLTATHLATAYQQHLREVGCPSLIIVVDKNIPLVTSWLTTAGVQAEVKANGGTSLNEVWLA